MDLKDFFNTVITSPPGWFCLSYADKNFVEWKELFYRWPEDQDKIIDQVHLLRQQYNVYWSSHLFSQQRSKKEYVLPTRTIQVDLDEADVFNFAIPPTVVVQTSERRYQAYWVLQGEVDLDQLELEKYARKVNYAIPDSDRSSWSLGHRVRIPETFNLKYDIAYPVTVISTAIKRVDITELETLPELAEQDIKLGDEEIEWLNKPHEDLSDKLPIQETVHSLYRAQVISLSSYTKYDKESKDDRSGILWQLMQEIFAAGFSRDDVYWVAYNSANNKWKDRPIRDLRKDVLRAEQKRSLKTRYLRGRIKEILASRQLGTKEERFDHVAEAIVNDIKSKGRFFHTRGGEVYYVEHEIGRPAVIPSTEWATKSTIQHGINSSTYPYRYINHHICAMVRSTGQPTEVASMSYYNPGSNTILLHSGGKDVYVIRPDNLSTMSNGSSPDILFHTHGAPEPFSLDYKTELPRPWYEFLFNSSLEYVDGIDKKQALALLTTWFLYSILRKGWITRPLLTLIGQPGSGKTFIGRTVCKILYGKHRDVHSLTTESDYDLIVSRNPVVFYDNVDTKQDWIFDRLATSTTETEVEKRKLFTDDITVKLTREAFVAVTSHEPKFLRADVADRSLIINFRRRERNGKDDFGIEAVLVGMLARYRNAVWAAIVKDLQKILNTPKPQYNELPSYRIQDYAAAGTWIARALDMERSFIEGISANKSRQSNTVLEQESLLVNLITKWITEHPEKEYVTVSELWQGLVGFGFETEQTNFQRTYRNSTYLSSRLFTLYKDLKERFEIDFKKDPKTEVRLWRIKLKEGALNGRQS